jgi:hypothetical protein
MKKITLAEDSLPFNYLEELDISLESLAIRCINEKFPRLNFEECENIFEEYVKWMLFRQFVNIVA